MQRTSTTDMLRVVEGLQSGEPETSVVDHLLGIEIHHMGLSMTANTRKRAAVTVAAVRRLLEASSA
jgi:hypothetical protein